MLPKTGSRNDVKNWRPIAILRITYKIFARLLFARLQPVLEREQTRDQVGFRPGRSVDDAFVVLEDLCTKAWEWELPLWIASIDLTKAFDRLEHHVLFRALSEQGVDVEYVRLLSDIYSAQWGSVNGSAAFDITRGVKQGDVLSSLLFNAGLEHAVRKFKARAQQCGFDVGGVSLLSNMRYADDILLYARSAAEVTRMLDILSEELAACGLALNSEKTRIFTNDVGVSNAEEPLVLQLAGCQLPVMTSQVFHKYLGKKFGGDLRSRSACNVNYRMECAWGKFHTHKAVLLNKAVSLRLRLKLFDVVVTPTALYGLSTTATTAQQRSLIASTRSKMLRRIVGFSKLPGESWEEAGRRCKQKVRVALNIFPVSDWLVVLDRCTWRLVARVLTGDSHGWPSQVLRWIPAGVRRRGRPRRRWTDAIDSFLRQEHGTNLTRVIRSRERFPWQRLENAFLDFMRNN